MLAGLLGRGELGLRASQGATRREAVTLTRIDARARAGLGREGALLGGAGPRLGLLRIGEALLRVGDLAGGRGGVVLCAALGVLGVGERARGGLLGGLDLRAAASSPRAAAWCSRPSIAR